MERLVDPRSGELQLVYPYKQLAPSPLAKPYITVHVTGPNGAGADVPGLLDSGADCTTFPIGYAGKMGYEGEFSLSDQESQTASGLTATLKGDAFSVMWLNELPELTMRFRPWFSKDLHVVLFGRTDFMSMFRVTIMETRQRFALTPSG